MTRSSAIGSILAKPQGLAVQMAHQHALQVTEKSTVNHADAPAANVKTAAVIGAGTMGTGIALSLSQVSISTKLIDTNADQLATANAMMDKVLRGMVAKGRISQDECDLRKSRITTGTKISELDGVDLVVEAVYESLETKLELFAQIDKYAAPGALLATNTSYLDVEKIALATGRPENVVGLHFFAPAHIMRLLEIVRIPQTAARTLARAAALAQQIGKVGVVSGNAQGFIGNRIMQAYIRQAHLMVYEGVPPRAIDRAIESFGFSMGPIRIGDMSGLDVGYRARRDRALTPEEQKAFQIADRLVEAGRLGVKTGGGFYDYQPGERTPLPSADAQAIIDSVSDGSADIGDEEIAERCLYALVAEAYRVFEEGIASQLDDIDAVYLNGYGFPKDRGGPIWWVEHHVGLEHVTRRMAELFARTGYPGLNPAPVSCRLKSRPDV